MGGVFQVKMSVFRIGELRVHIFPAKEWFFADFLLFYTSFIMFKPITIALPCRHAAMPPCRQAPPAQPSPPCRQPPAASHRHAASHQPPSPASPAQTACRPAALPPCHPAPPPPAPCAPPGGGECFLRELLVGAESPKNRGCRRRSGDPILLEDLRCFFSVFFLRFYNVFRVLKLRNAFFSAVLKGYVESGSGGARGRWGVFSR